MGIEPLPDFSKVIYDLHVHSIASDGLHTVFEIIDIARSRGLIGVNISDHGPAQKHTNKISSNFIFNERFPPNPDFYGGIQIIKGIEANLLVDGTYDLFELKKIHPSRFDLISLGIHGDNTGFPRKQCEIFNTKKMLQCIENYPVDILTHPCTLAFPLNIEKIVNACVEKGIALEINNTNLRLGKTDLNQLKLMLKLVKAYGCRLVANSDGHTWHEIGCFEKIYEFLLIQKFPIDYILNTSEEKTLAFIKERKTLRQK